MNDGDGTEGGVLVEKSPRFDREGAPCVRIDPLSWRKVRLRLKRFPQHGGQPSANRFNRPVERIGSFQPEDRFRGGLNQRMMPSSSMATIPGGIDFRSVSARVFCSVTSS